MKLFDTYLERVYNEISADLSFNLRALYKFS